MCSFFSSRSFLFLFGVRESPLSISIDEKTNQPRSVGLDWRQKHKSVVAIENHWVATRFYPVAAQLEPVATHFDQVATEN